MAKKRIYTKIQRRLLKAWRRKTRKPSTKFAMLAIGVAVPAVALAYHQTSMHAFIHPSAYKPLLETIARGESAGNYNAHFGNAANTAVRFTDMSVSEILQWQAEYVRQGNVSNAVGRYQIIQPTLEGLVRELQIDLNAKFDETLQDKMAIALLERRGSLDYVNKKLSREQFAANLAMEWAALPKVIGTNPTESFYANDGINQSRVTIDEMYAALHKLQS